MCRTPAETVTSQCRVYNTVAEAIQWASIPDNEREYEVEVKEEAATEDRMERRRGRRSMKESVHQGEVTLENKT